MTEVTVEAARARRFLIDAFALGGFQTLPDARSAIERLEFVQEDSIPICGRMHDLILWQRVAGYTPAHLHDVLYGPRRSAFEHYLPNLSALPLDDYPHFVGRMRARRETPGRWGALTDDEAAIATDLFARIDADGAVRPRTLGPDHGHALSGWGTRARRMTLVAEKLWLHGRLTIARRENFERWFDRTERLLPDLAHWHADAATLPDAIESSRHLARKRLRARRLFRLRKDERALLGDDAVTRVRIVGVERPWQCLREDAQRLAESAPGTPTGTFLLAPLDPLIYDRERTRALFDYDYIWEVYTPVDKRVRGYYALPILQGERIVGHVDPKLDRKRSRLEIVSLVLDPAADPAPVRARIEDFARWHGATEIVWPPAFNRPR